MSADDPDLVQVQRLCERLGAAPAQARVMATQLLKRAEQLAAERDCTRVEAMRYLLELTTKGATGEPPVGFEGGRPPEPPIPPESPQSNGSV